ncbi:MFS transporter, partial [Candidatus Cryosericum odellii]
MTGALSAAFQTFQWPAYSAAISMMVPKKQYQRASGMISMAESGSGIAAPILAGALAGVLGFQRLWVIFAIDLATFVVALGALIVVAIPNPPHVESDHPESLFSQSMFGFRYIWQHRPLFDLQMLFFASNLIASLCITILPALILARTGNNATALGSTQSAAAVGGVVGGVLLTAWGGPKRKVNGVLLGMVLTSLFGTLVIGLG